jgi:hypothetical protein
MVQAVSSEVDGVSPIATGRSGWGSRKFVRDHRVHIYPEDSSEILAALVGSQDRPALFWFDARYSAGITARGATDTPIISEFGAARA